MDNLTHTVIGWIAGESVAHANRSPETGVGARARRGLLIAAFAIGGNLPDLDLLVSYRGFSRNKLGYMLEHRGYTHTVLGCIALALLLYGALELFMRWRHLRPTRSDRRLILAAALIGTLLHLLMDFFNSYGVHPFWPFNNHWYYGDSVFIVEPLYWIATAPLFFVQRSAVARACVGIIVTLAIVLSLVTKGLVPLPIVMGEALLSGLLFFIGSRVRPSAAAFASLAVALVGTAVFIACGGAAMAASERLAGSSAPLTDHILTPMPANPVCWDLIQVQEETGNLRLRHAIISIAPGWVTARQCPRGLASGITTAPFTPVLRTDTASVRWIGEVEMPAARFAELASRSCNARGLMRFARAPFLADSGAVTVIGDLRFDREPGLGFSEFAVRESDAPKAACPEMPPWTPPRAELLN